MENLLLHPWIFPFNYLLGFMLAIFVALPVTHYNFKYLVPNSKSDKKPLYFLIVILSTIVAPHCASVINLLLVLMMVWLMTLIAFIFEIDNLLPNKKYYYLLIVLSLGYGLVNNVSYPQILCAALVYVLAIVIYKVNPDREKIVSIFFNPGVLFTILSTIPFNSFAIYFLYIIKSVLAVIILRFIFLKLSYKISYKDEIFKTLMFCQKFYFMAWYSSIIYINPHIYQLI